MGWLKDEEKLCICGKERESTEHLTSRCEFAKIVWELTREEWEKLTDGDANAPPPSIYEIAAIKFKQKTPQQQEIWTALIGININTLWHFRNLVKFNKEQPTTETLKSLFKKKVEASQLHRRATSREVVGRRK